MTNIEFADAVEKMMNKKMKGGVRASLYTAMKNNGKERTGILIEMPGINISPTIYLEEYYESYVAGRKIEQIGTLFHSITLEHDFVIIIYGKRAKRDRRLSIFCGY